jgi:hypothetical protein
MTALIYLGTALVVWIAVTHVWWVTVRDATFYNWRVMLGPRAYRRWFFRLFLTALLDYAAKHRDEAPGADAESD